MKKWVVLYHAPAKLLEEMSHASAEDQARGMEAWNQWAHKCGDKLWDMGAPLASGEWMGGGDWKNWKEWQATGYSILQADSLEEAKALLKGHPHLEWDKSCSIELHEAVAMPVLN